MTNSLDIVYLCGYLKVSPIYVSTTTNNLVENSVYEEHRRLRSPQNTTTISIILDWLEYKD